MGAGGGRRWGREAAGALWRGGCSWRRERCGIAGAGAGRCTPTGSVRQSTAVDFADQKTATGGSARTGGEDGDRWGRW